VSVSTGNLFRSFVYSGDADKARIYASILGDYYSENKSWADAQPFLAEIPGLLFSTLDERIHGQHGGEPASAYPQDAVSALTSDRIVVADLNGVIVADTSGALLRTFHPQEHLMHGVPILSGSERTGTVLVGSMIDSSLGGINEQFLKSIMKSLLWATSFSAFIAFLLGLLFTTRVSRPLADLTKAARRVAKGDLTALVPVKGSDELSELSASFNAMTGELNRLEEAKKQIIADSAHELRTPVTLIQGTIEAMIDGIYPLDIPTLEGLHEETLRLSRLIDTLRELEIIESGKLELKFEEIDIQATIQKALSLFASAAKEKGLTLTLSGSSPVPLLLKADPLRMDEVVYNLLSNAIKYTPVQGQVCVGAIWDIASSSIILRIEDSGPGIPETERERIFERFYRIDKSRATERGGRGLGLAIANEIVKAHGGSISVEESSLGGAAFVVRLPAK
jgi:signal transduction histidine kinase